METIKKGDTLIYNDGNGCFHKARIMKTNEKFTYISISFSDCFKEEVLQTEKLINYLNGGIAESNKAVSRYSLSKI
jgi:hypothetical protein